MRDILGQRFGMLVAIEPTDKRRESDNAVYWRFKCDCGRIVERTATSMIATAKRGLISSCGPDCPSKPDKRKPFHGKDLTGQKIGKLTILEPTGNLDKRRYRIWLCRCDCGEIVEKSTAILYDNLQNGQDPNCGKPSCNNFPKRAFGEAVRNQIVEAYRRNARNRGLSFELTNEDLDRLFTGNCFYCNEPPSTIAKRRDAYGTFVYNGIDRLDNTKGYVIGNVVSCCKMCNRAKVDLSVDEFLGWIEKVAQFQGLG